MLFTNTKPSFKRTISRDLILSLSGIVLLIMALGALWYQSRSAHHLESELDLQAALLTEEIADIISFPLRNEDEQTIGHIARAFSKGNDYVAGVQIENKEGKIIIDTISDQHPFEVSKEKTLTDKNGVAGSLMVVFTDIKLRQARKDTIRTSLQVTLFIIIVTAAGIYLFLHLWLNRPIEYLTRGIRSIADGEYKTPLPLPPQRELAAIANEINDMAEQITQKNKDLELSEKKYRSIFNGAQEGIFQTTANGTILTANPALARILGYETPEQLIKHSPDLAQEIYVDRQDRKNMLDLLARQGIISNFITRAYHRDGHIIWVSLDVRAVYDQDGNIRILEGALEDITTRKQLEADLAQARKMEAIGTLAGGIAHDFNNILSAIFGYIELAQAGAGTNDKVLKNLNNAMNAAKRAQDLTQQILTFSRKKSRQKNLFSVAPIVKDALKLIRSSIPASIEIHRKINSSAAIIADPTRIHQVVMNLCTNAYQSMEQQTGTLTIALEDTIIDQELADDLKLKPGNYIILEVSDTGKGMDQQTIAKIFEPYFTTRTGRKGTGLGLSTVHGIVQECGGRVSVDSEPGTGTSFRVYLPAAEKRPIPATAEGQDGQEFAGNGEQVLIVDDEPMIQEIISSFLSENGYQPTSLNNAPDALKAIKDDPAKWDLLITDMTMPEMTGEELAQRALKLRPDLPIILCTGYSASMNRERAKRIGISAYIQKPVMVSQLLACMRSILDRPETGESGL